jgi:ABC-type multidrug transport system fused ATPase/permease subunit
VRLVVSYIRMHPRPFAIPVIGAFLFAIGSVAVTVALGWETDRVPRPAFTPEGVDASTIWLGIGPVRGLTALRALGIGIRRYYSGVTGAAAAATLRERVSDRYRALSYLRIRPTGEVLAHKEADVEAAIEVLSRIPFAIGVIGERRRLLGAVSLLRSLVARQTERGRSAPVPFDASRLFHMNGRSTFRAASDSPHERVGSYSGESLI